MEPQKSVTVLTDLAADMNHHAHNQIAIWRHPSVLLDKNQQAADQEIVP
jgi:hypothetical protein